MDNIQKLEAELDQAKKAANNLAWENYLIEMRETLNKLRNKTILSWWRNGAFAIYQVKDVIENHDTANGFFGQWHPSKWFELTSNTHITCHIPDSDKVWWKPKTEQSTDIQKLKFIKLPKLVGNLLEIAKIDFQDLSINKTGCGDILNVVKIGYDEYTNKTDTPIAHRSLHNLFHSSYIVPDIIYEKAHEIHMDNVRKTIEFWRVYEKEIKSAQKINDIIFKRNF